VNPDLQVPDTFFTPPGGFKIAEKLSQLHRRHHHFHRIGDILCRNSAGAHVGVANGSDLFNVIFPDDPVKLEENFIQFIHHQCRVNLLRHVRETLNAGKKDRDHVELETLILFFHPDPFQLIVFNKKPVFLSGFKKPLLLTLKFFNLLLQLLVLADKPCNSPEKPFFGF